MVWLFKAFLSSYSMRIHFYHSSLDLFVFWQKRKKYKIKYQATFYVWYKLLLPPSFLFCILCYTGESLGTFRHAGSEITGLYDLCFPTHVCVVCTHIPAHMNSRLNLQFTIVRDSYRFSLVEFLYVTRTVVIGDIMWQFLNFSFIIIPLWNFSTFAQIWVLVLILK